MTQPNDTNLVRVELLISRLLAWGVLTSLSLIVLGTVLSFTVGHDYGAGGGSPEDLQRLISGGMPFTLSIGWLWHGLLALRGDAIVVLGLLLLIATPALRVAVSVVAFILEKDRPYVLITLTVLILMAISLVLGKAG